MIICECCEREPHDNEAFEGTIHGHFCPDCLASLTAEGDRLRAALPRRIALCPQCAPEFYYPLQDGEGLSCPTMDCGFQMVVYERQPGPVGNPAARPSGRPLDGDEPGPREPTPHNHQTHHSHPEENL